MSPLLVIVSTFGVIGGFILLIGGICEGEKEYTYAGIAGALIAALVMTYTITSSSEIDSLKASLQETEVRYSETLYAHEKTKAKIDVLEVKQLAYRERMETYKHTVVAQQEQLRELKGELKAAAEALAKEKALGKVDQERYDALKAKYDKLAKVLQEIKGVTHD